MLLRLRHRASAGLVTAAAALALATAAASPAQAAAGAEKLPSIGDRAYALEVEALKTFVEKSDAKDPRYWENGKFTYVNTPWCPICDSGAALGALLTYAQRPTPENEWMRRVGIETFDTVLSGSQRADGAISVSGEVLDIATTFLGNGAGLAVVLAGDVLPAEVKARWAKVTIGAADFLIKNGNLRWYTNGNIVVANALTVALAHRLTGDAKYATAYETAINFAVSPPQVRWPGYGLVTSREPTRADGADGAGFLAETNGLVPPGFDAEYTAVQGDAAASLLTIVDDPRVLRLTNLISGAILPRVDAQQFLDTSGGTRHTQADRKVPFMSAFPTVLASAGRTDLRSGLGAQLTGIETYVRGAYKYTNLDVYKTLGARLGLIMVAAGGVSSATPAPVAVPTAGAAPTQTQTQTQTTTTTTQPTTGTTTAPRKTATTTNGVRATTRATAPTVTAQPAPAAAKVTSTSASAKLSRQRVRSATKDGLRFVVSCTAACGQVALDVQVDAATARRLGIARNVATTTVAAAGTKATVTARFSAKAKRALRRQRAARVTIGARARATGAHTVALAKS